MELATGSSSDVGILLALLSALLLLLSTILWLWLVVLRRQQDGSKPSGPKCWPIFGTFFELTYNFERMHDWLTDYFATGALTFSVRLGGQNMLFTADPAVCEHVLKTNFPNYPKGELFHTMMEPLLGDGIFNTDGELWKKQRKAASVEFSSKVLSDFSSVVHRSNALALVSMVTRACFDHKSLDMQDLFMRLTLDAICKVAFGVDVGSLSPHLPDLPFARAFEQASRSCSNRFTDPLWKLKRTFHLGSEAPLPRSSAYLDDFTYQVIRTRRQELEAVANPNLTRDEKPIRADLLSRLMLLSEEFNDGKLSQGAADKALRDSVLNVVIAGRDTTAATLSWFMYNLCIHPEVGDKIYEEVCAFERKQQQTAGGDFNLESLDEAQLSKRIEEFAQLLEYESIVSSFVYLHAAVTETIRLHPAVPQDAKGTLADDVLPNGMTARKGDLICYVPYSMGRLKSLWGPDALEFKPERWLKDGVFQPASPFKFTAFQAGPRNCLGKGAAYLQIKLVTALLCRFFKFQLVPGQQICYQKSIILTIAGGIRVVATKRAR